MKKCSWEMVPSFWFPSELPAELFKYTGIRPDLLNQHFDQVLQVILMPSYYWDSLLTPSLLVTYVLCQEGLPVASSVAHTDSAWRTGFPGGDPSTNSHCALPVSSLEQFTTKHCFGGWVHRQKSPVLWRVYSCRGNRSSYLLVQCLISSHLCLLS